MSRWFASAAPTAVCLALAALISVSCAAPRRVEVGRSSASESTATYRFGGLKAEAFESHATPGKNVVVTATIRMPAAQARRLTVVADFDDAAGHRVKIAMKYESSTGALSRFTAALDVPVGNSVEIFVTADGGRVHRVTSTGVYLPNRAATIGRVHDDKLIDTDGDGKPDAISAPVTVTTPAGGSYVLVVDLKVGKRVIANASGHATLRAGTSDLPVIIPLRGLLAAGAPSGTFRLARGILTTGLLTGREPTLIDESADMGLTASYDLDSYRPVSPILSRLSERNVDDDGDGMYDTLRVSADASVPNPGIYRLTGTLYGPSGKPIAQIDQTRHLSAGRSPLRVDFDGQLIVAFGSGSYAVRGVELADEARTSPTTEGTLFLKVDATQWS
jgi:hypothetical protein